MYDPALGTWSATGSMTAGRQSHIALLLPDGRVLVAGGISSSGVLASAELYDPAAGTWSATGSMTAGRYIHTATLLPDGKVLVTGGLNSSGSLTSALASAEVYDPALGTWSATSSMNVNRYNHSATLLPDGKVLVAGGRGTSDVLASAELYDPAAGTWNATGSMNVNRYSHIVTLLPDGKVLVAGGYNFSSGSLASAEVYDPALGTWNVTGPMNAIRYSHIAALLSDGKVLVTGGASNSGLLASAEVYETALDSTPPTANAGGPYSGNEDTAIAMSGASASDPELDMLTYNWSVDSALCSFDDPGTLNPNLTCTDSGSFTATLSVDDGTNPPVTSDAAVTVDNVAPTVAMNSAALDPTNTSPIPVTVQFSEDVTGFIDTDITTSNGTVGNFVTVDGDTYTFDLTPASQGLVTADITAEVAQDAAGNGNSASAQFSRTFNNIAPTVTINEATGQADPTGASPILFDVVFSEAVTNFDDAADVDLSASTAPGTLSAAILPIDAQSYTVSVSGMTGDGTVTASIPAGAAIDAAGNANTASTSTDNTVTFIVSNPVLDDFNRANGKAGSNWAGATGTSFYKINGNRLDVQLGGPLIWKPTSFDTSQEAFVTLNTIDLRSPSQGLMLKVQASSGPDAGAIIVVYDAAAGAVRVSTLRRNNPIWTPYTNIPATFANGDQLGARALSNGTVEIYQNGALITTVTLNAADQAFFNSKGGRIGLWTLAARNAFFEDFGGGNVVLP